MKQSLIFLVLLCFWSRNLYTQNGTAPGSGTRGAGMGNASVCFTDINSAFSNQAGLAYLETFAAGVNAERRFSLNELQNLSAAAALPTESGTFGVTINYFGFEGYNEQRLGLAYGRKLFNNLSIGGQLLYMNTKIPEYGNRGNFTFELGFLSHFLPKLNIGAHIYSPVRSKTLDDEALPTIINFGLNYLPSDKLEINAGVEKHIDYKIRVKAGIEYKIIEALSLRTGMINQPFSYSFGAGYHLKNGIQIDIAANWHEYLGLSPGFGIMYNVSKN